ncbi:MBL fold metallo-hydrolase [Loktanella sp. Alg231-35]|uniref:MBL fold metallo-hydrolase n=1 Tax=Loktanella sp. Alg231-35 TaxID=1922220 RepID=UPI000D54FEF9|nr:MBL fold metallo-hydrolase [Loktanella sp. Alg231-35]
MIRPIFTNTASIRTRARWVLNGGRGPVDLQVRVGLIIHPTFGPVLIDAGYGPQVTQAPGRSWALRAYDRVLGPKLQALQSPLALLAAHGFDPEDVNLIFVTHLHADHVAYLPAFPNARFVTDDQVTDALRHGVFKELLPKDFVERQIDLRSYRLAALPFGLGQGYDLLGDGSVIGVPLPGHAPGHFGLCFTGKTPLLYAVDTQWVLAAIHEDRCPGLPASLIADDGQAAARSVALVCAFAQAGGDVMLCHDPAPTQWDWAPDV